GWQRAGLVAKRARALLPQRRRHDGGRHRDKPGVRRGETTATIRGKLRDVYCPLAELWRCRRRPAICDGQANRSRGSASPDQRRDQLVRRAETPRALEPEGVTQLRGLARQVANPPTRM